MFCSHTGHCELRRGRRLVVQFIATLANYEYALSWSFKTVSLPPLAGDKQGTWKVMACSRSSRIGLTVRLVIKLSASQPNRASS